MLPRYPYQKCQIWYRCSKTGSKEVKVSKGGLFICKKPGVEKGTNKAKQRGLIDAKRENKIHE